MESMAPPRGGITGVSLRLSLLACSDMAAIAACKIQGMKMRGGSFTSIGFGVGNPI